MLLVLKCKTSKKDLGLVLLETFHEFFVCATLLDIVSIWCTKSQLNWQILFGKTNWIQTQHQSPTHLVDMILQLQFQDARKPRNDLNIWNFPASQEDILYEITPKWYWEFPIVWRKPSLMNTWFLYFVHKHVPNISIYKHVFYIDYSVFFWGVIPLVSSFFKQQNTNGACGEGILIGTNSWGEIGTNRAGLRCPGSHDHIPSWCLGPMPEMPCYGLPRWK